MNAPIPLEEAIAIVLGSVEWMGFEHVSLTEAYDRILTHAVIAPTELPPYSASLMDGYAVKTGSERFRVAFEIPAGRAPSRSLVPGECARIFTGGLIPDGADAVVKQEDVDRTGDEIRLRDPTAAGLHIRAAGSDAHAHDLLIPHGTKLGPGALTLIASLGATSLSVARRPRVCVLATGDELRPAGGLLAPGLIYESNTVGLERQVEEAGAVAHNLGIASDDPVLIAGKLRSVDTDIYVTTGGASVGDYDFAEAVLERLGGKRHFWQVAIRPGKPTLFGTIPRPSGSPSLYFALPGNPGASALTFDQFVRPAIRAMIGAVPPRRRRVNARLIEPLKKPKGLSALIRGELVECNAKLMFRATPWQGSMSVRSLSGLSAVAIMGAEVTSLNAGELVSVEPWGTVVPCE